MWIVRNELKGRVRFPGLNLEIPPGEEVDLDKIGREKAEASTQIKLALENQYLKTLRKTVTMDESDLEQIIEQRVATIKEKLVKEISDLYTDGKSVLPNGRGL